MKNSFMFKNILSISIVLLFILCNLSIKAQSNLLHNNTDYQIMKKIGQPFYSGEVLPKPQIYKYRENNTTIVDGEKLLDCYDIIFKCSFPSVKLAEILLNKRISAFRSAFKDARWTVAPKSAIIPIIFAKNNTAAAVSALKLCGNKNTKLKLKAQGYMLTIKPKAIVCIAADNCGLINGMASLIQLMHVRNSKLVVRCANITDWPVFKYRYVSEYHFPSVKFFQWLTTYKINGFTSAYFAISWTEISAKNITGLSRLKTFMDKYKTLYYMAQIHIGGRRHFKKMDCGNEKQIQKLLGVIEKLIKKYGAKHIMLCNDDVLSELTLPEEKRRFKTPGEAHGYVVDRAYKHIKKINPKVELSFVTTYYRGRRWRNWRKNNPKYNDSMAYMADVRKWNPNVAIVWTGPTTESRSIKIEDIKHYKNLIGKDRPLLYYDNTWNYHQPLRNFHAKYMSNFVELCMNKIAYINIKASQPLGRFFIGTVSDYYWNPNGFDAAWSRDQAVVQFMGAKALPATKEFYKLRGEDYYVRFKKKVNLEKFKKVLENLEKTSLDKGIVKYCWRSYKNIVNTRKNSKKTK